MATLSDAAKEAIITAPIDEVNLYCLEFLYDGLEDEDGNPTSIFIALADEDFTARLEDNALVKAGELVEFKAVPLEVVKPSLDKDKIPNFQMKIDGVSRELMPQFNYLAENPRIVRQNFREFLLSTKDDGPEVVTALPFEVRSVNIDPQEIIITSIAPNISSIPVPNYLIDLEKLPTLA